MLERKKRFWMIAGAATLLALWTAAGSAPAGQQSDDERFTRTLRIGPRGSFSLSNIAGDVVLRGGSGDEVRIEAVKRVRGRRRGEDVVDIDVSQTGDRVRVQTRYGGGNRHREVSVSYDVTVPRGTRVEVKCVSGDVEIRDLGGELEGQSVSGDVRVSDVEHLVRAKSVSGSVTVTTARSPGLMEIASVSGDVEVHDASADSLDVSSVSGNVELIGVASGSAAVKSVSGNIEYEGRLASAGRYELSSHSGNVRLRIDEEPGFELEAKTFSGDVRSDFPIQMESLTGRHKRLEGVYGDGSAFIDAASFSGNIILERRRRR